MIHLKNVFKIVEIELRVNNKLSKETLESLSELSDWDFRIIQGFITELKLHLQKETSLSEFLYKKYNIEEPIKNKQKLDLLICLTKRKKEDLVLTDVTNRLVIPQELKWDILETWGLPVEQARNYCVNDALSKGAKYILFIDDDMIIENTGLLKLFDEMNNSNALVVAGEYQRKAEYEVSAHGNKLEETDNSYKTDLCAMGFTLINIHEVTKKVPAPYFWVFLAPDGLWSMGEDAFFTKNLIEYTDSYPIIRKDISILHYDKKWKRTFGKRDKNITYATNKIDDFVTFDHIRIPPTHPLISIAVPRRNEQEPIAFDLNKLPIDRAYKSTVISVTNQPVDMARNNLVIETVNNDSKYIFFVDNDIVLPKDGLSNLIQVMENDKDEEIGMVTGDYLLKGKPLHSVHLQLDEEGKVAELQKIKSGKYFKDNKNWLEANWLCGMGCALIRTSVFRQIQYPWFMCHNIKHDGDGGVNEDAHITEMLLNNGYKVIHDKRVKCLHVDFNNKQYYGFEKEININNYAGFDWLNQIEYISME